MELIWFYVAIVLAISDILHTQLMWKVLNDFYVILGGLIYHSVDYSPWKTWVIHELMEAAFHFVILSIVFLSPTIGLLAALTHFVIDVSHTVLIGHMGELEHRALHFIIESVVFMLIYGL
ncbi:MAG: hypothetical protein J6M91_09835 [Methanobrevibacter sp.]|jgi:hypothetical protein|nr:hypothetical protein [Methanobrevibacter sp.]